MASLSRLRLALGLGLVGWLAVVPSTGRAAGGLEARLSDIDSRVAGLEKQVDELGMDFSRRRGLIGSVEARYRFEEAVYQFLIGEYETAALSFYTLVDSQALTVPALHKDSEWYLAECLFELGNLGTAAEAYGRVVADGNNHPFFKDAVRRLLEVHGLTRDSEAFNEVYQTYIVSGRVQATDFVKYTVAKSFWRQGQDARALAMFDSVAPDSSSYLRSRYFVGMMLSEQGKLDEATAQFRKVVETPGTGDPSDAVVIELGWLAVGRIAYEVGDFATATAAYQKISKNSPYYADQLYELVWSYVKQERWSEALDYLDIFLLGFPNHREAVNLELTRAHVLMKEGRREEALSSYESVVEDYTPIEEQLDLLKVNRDDPIGYFRRLASSADGKLAEGEDLPAFAVEILVDDEAMGRAVEVYRAMDAQQDDLEINQSRIEQVGEALRRADSNIGTFARGRSTLRGAQDDALNAKAALLGYEIDYLLSKGNSLDRDALNAIAGRFAVIQGSNDEAEAETSTDTGKLQVWDAQVRAVQAYGSRVEAAAEAELARGRSLSSLLDENPRRLSSSQVSGLRAQLDAETEELRRALMALQRQTADSTRSSLLAMVASRAEAPGAGRRSQVAREYAALRADLGRYRSNAAAADASAVFTKLDDLWDRASSLDGRSQAILDRLDSSERTEIELLRRRLAEETERVARSRAELGLIQGGSAEIATLVAQDAFARLQEEIGRTVEEADLGIVDVYWLKRTDIGDEMTRIGKEQSSALRLQDDRFRLVRQKLDAGANAGEKKGQ